MSSEINKNIEPVLINNKMYFIDKNLYEDLLKDVKINYIQKSKVEEKIEEYKKISEEYEKRKKDDFLGFWQQAFLKACHKYQALQELLKGDELNG